MHYRLFFLRSIAQFFTQIYMNFGQFISWTNWVKCGIFMDNCWKKCQVMADLKKSLQRSHNYYPVHYWVAISRLKFLYAGNYFGYQSITINLIIMTKMCFSFKIHKCYYQILKISNVKYTTTYLQCTLYIFFIFSLKRFMHVLSIKYCTLDIFFWKKAALKQRNSL